MVNWNLHYCNTTLGTESTDNEIKAYGSLTFHQLGLIISAVTGLFATILSFFLIFRHATHYSKPTEQRHIIRILFMIPVYSVVSFLSFYFYHHYVYYQVLRDCYDAFAIASFFSLLCSYIGPDLHNQKDYFRELTPKNWLLPVSWMQKCCGTQRKGPWRVPRSGLTWFNIIWVFIFQYCLLRVVLTIVAVITEYYGRYCVEGLSPAYFHIWSTVISAVSVSFAMYCLIQFYYQIRLDIAEHSPLLKIISIKLVIFFVFWQTIILGFLNGSGVIVASAKIAQPDITIGIPAVLICIEMALFSILHIFAYPIKEYRLGSGNEAGAGEPLGKVHYQGGPLGIKAYAQAFNPWDIIKAIGRGFKWAMIGRRTRENDPSYKKDLNSTPLQEGVPTKGRYEQLDDFHADDEHYTYDTYGGEIARPGLANNGLSDGSGTNHYDQGPIGAGRTTADHAFSSSQQHVQNAGAAPASFYQDTSYHTPQQHNAVHAQQSYMPDESQYQPGHAR